MYQAAFAEPPWNEAWSANDVENDLRFAEAQQDSIVLVAQDGRELLGFTWGYRISLVKFPFLDGLVDDRANYMDEIAVSRRLRRQGVGKLLVMTYLEAVERRGLPSSVLRTDERNPASMGLFARMGYLPLKDKERTVYDPALPYRVYLGRQV